MKLFSFVAAFTLALPSFAETDRLFIHCQPKDVELKARIKATYWKGEIESRWCRGKRSGRYPLVVACSPGTAGNSHLTTFTFDTPLLVNQAKVDIDPTNDDVWDKGLPHGLAHAILPTCFPGEVPVLDMPGWILEGLAQSIYSGIWEDYQKAFGKEGVNGFQKLEDLWFTESRELKFLTQAGLFVRYLSEEVAPPAKFVEFVAELHFDRAPVRSLAALGQYVRTFKKVYGQSVTDLNESFRNYVKREAKKAATP